MKKMTGRKVLSFAMASAMTMGMGTAAMAEETTTYPMDTDAKFVYWGEINGSVSANFNSLGDTEIGKDWQKNTGVTIEFQHPTVRVSRSEDLFGRKRIQYHGRWSVA